MSKREGLTPFRLAGTEVRPGTSAMIELTIARQPHGTWSTMPVVVMHGGRPGPVIWVNGALHGDELNGIEIVRQLLLELDPSKLSGTVLAVPIVNIFAVSMGSRYLPDRRDLNRSFPGSPRGSLASQLANHFFSEVVSRCSVGIDFHTGSGGRSNLPQIRCDLDDPKTFSLAKAFGPPLLLHSALRDGSLRAAARKRGAHVLLYEAGEANRFDESAIQAGVMGTLRVLKTLEMIGNAPKSGRLTPLISRSSKWMRAGRSGFCHIVAEPGRRVATGETVAMINDSVGRKQLPVRSRVNGIVIGVLRDAMVHRGDAITHVAEATA